MKDTQTIHPIVRDWDKLQEEDILVFDDIHSLPPEDNTFASECLTIGLCMSGHVRAEYDTLPVEIGPQDIAVVMPKHTVTAVDISEDYCAMLIVISEKMFDAMKRTYPSEYQESLHWHWQAQFHLDDYQFENIRMVYRLLQNACQLKGPRRLRIVRHLLETLFVLLQEYREQNGMAQHRPSPHELLFARFVDAITENYAKSREVRYYADLFCLSAKHFANIIKRQTGINASDWISSYVTTQAKTRLLYHRQLSIQQIALQLGFPDQATFARYFKKQTGQTPRDYRERRE